MVSEQRKLQCPLLFPVGEEYFCLQEKCAWWDSKNQQCAILSLTDAMYIAGTIRL